MIAFLFKMLVKRTNDATGRHHVCEFFYDECSRFTLKCAYPACVAESASEQFGFLSGSHVAVEHLD
jgi:hypothetical protein